MTVIPPLNINDKCQIQWRDDKEQQLDAVVIERRALGHRKRKRQSLHDLGANEIEYYVHYSGQDRRLDEWVTLDKFNLSSLKRHTGEQEENQGSQRRTSLQLSHEHTNGVASSGSHHNHHHDAPSSHNGSSELTTAEPFRLTGGNWHGRGSDGSAFEREHEQATKVKNIETIIMGNFKIEAWYYSPFPADYCDLETLYVCEYCLAYMKRVKNYKQHLQTCTYRTPPGQKIYAHEEIAVYEIDGKDHKAYCQKLFLLAKLFLDHKTLYFETSPFMVYVVTKVDEQGSKIVGFFSKEKASTEGYNLACILTLPQFQKCGYGKFIISLSYELTKREGKTGSPEKPLSDLGKVSYRSYWTHVLMNVLAEHNVDEDTNVNLISEQTGIKTEDLISTLQHLDMIKVWKGQHVIYVQQKRIQEYLQQDKKIRLCRPEFLKWTPPAGLPALVSPTTSEKKSCS